MAPLRAGFAVAVATIVIAAACGGDDGGSENTPPPTPERTFALLPIESIAAIGDYIGTTGFDGFTFDLTDPAGCEAIQEEQSAASSEEEREQIIRNTLGRLCINRAVSLIEGDRATVAVQDYTTGEGWVLSLQRTEGVWEVTDAVALGSVDQE